MFSVMTVILCLVTLSCFAQNGVTGPVGLYGSAYNAATTLRSGGVLFVGNGGNWYLGGTITGLDKGNPNSPTATGQAETITFDGTGKVSNAATSPGAAGNHINAYAATTGTAASALVLPVGGSSAVYPFTVPAGTAIRVGYFDGSGSSTNIPVNGTTTTEFSEYYDVPSGVPAGSYSLSYPAGLTPGNNAVLSSAAGTSFKLLTDIPNISTSAGTVVSASLPAATATRLYLSTSVIILPVHLENFQGSRQPAYNLLQWTVADARQVDHFELTKHDDGGVFAPVASIPAFDSLTSYSYQDVANQGNDFYQLAVIGKDRSVTYSQVVYLPAAAAASSGDAIGVHPNPVGTALSFTVYSAVQAELSCRIVDIKGGERLHKIVLVQGNSDITWDVSSLSRGVYLLQVVNRQTGRSQSVEFIKL